MFRNHFVEAEHGSRLFQGIIHGRRERVLATQDTPCDPICVLEHLHGRADIVERGSGILVERRRAKSPHLDIYESITFGIESYTERLGAAVRLRRVSSAWSRALLKRMASLKGRVDRLASEKRTLKGIKRTAHAIYEEYYSDDLDFANY